MGKKYVYGVDVGGTTCKIGLFNTSGEVLEKWEIHTRTEDNGVNIIPDVAVAIKDNMTAKGISADEVAGVGLGVPGPVQEDGTVLVAVNLGWGTFNPCKELEENLGVPVKAGNDANVAALGEMWMGAGKGLDNIVLMTLGTGIGGGVIIGGRILTGVTGSAGEIGHMHVDDDEELACNCGGKGCLEQYGSATGIVRIAERVLAATDEGSSLRDLEAVTAKDVWDAVKAGDGVAKQIADKFGYYMGSATASIAAVTNPEAFVIGGGVSKAGEVLFEYIRPYYEKYAFSGCRDTKFILATLGNDAGIYGAAKLVLE